VILSRRINGIRLKRDSSIGTQRLTLSEENVLVQKVLELDYRGIPIRLDKLRDFVSLITEARGICYERFSGIVKEYLSI
jgi:hypothetical protein